MSVPVFNLPQIFNQRDKLLDNLAEYVGILLTAPVFEEFINDILILLPEGIAYGPVYESAVHLLNEELTKSMLLELVWKLAGNLPALKNGKSIPKWVGQSKPEWMPIQVLAANRTTTIKGEPGYLYKLRILAGSACPLLIWKIWPSKACRFVSSKIGFSPPWKQIPYRDGHELVSMRFLVEIDAKYCRDNQPGFENIHCTASLTKWNKAILMARAHIDPPCPFGFTHFCYKCPVGYDKCKAGTHPKTYEVAFCSICNEDTWHDPGSGDICVACREKLRKDN